MKTNIKYFALTLFLASVFSPVISQNVGINTDGTAPHASAMLDVVSSDKGILIPRIDIADLSTAAPVTAPATGLLAYNTNTTSGVGFYYWDGSEWVQLVGQSAVDDAIDDKAWLLEGNAGTTVGTDFIGTTDNVGLAFKTNDAERMRILNGGNVGIGITDPSTLLEVKDNEAIKIGKAFLSSGQSGTARMLHLATNAWADATDWNFPATNEAGALIQMVNDDINFWRHGGGETAGYDYGTFSQSMRIHNSGNVGIGDFVLSPPDDLLHVKGIIRIPGSEGNDYQIRGGDNISTGVAIRATSNPSNNQSIFGVESSGAATRFGVTQGNGTFARDGFWVGTYDNGELTPSVGLNRAGSDMILLTDNP